MKGEVNKTKVDTADELLARTLDAAGCIKESEDQLRRTTRDLRTRVAKSTEVFFFSPNATTCPFVDFVVLPPGHGRSVTDF